MAKKQFKAESKRLLDLMIHSIYTHKEIFLRELLSNASDAIDKLHFKALTDSSVQSDFSIRISADKQARTLTVSDNGVGMTKDELETNLGVIAKSGSLDFKSEHQSDDLDIIGQFGVGFYSAFMVADQVTVSSRAYGAEQAYCWSSTGTDGYTISECDKPETGTAVTLRIKDDSEQESYSEFLDEFRIKQLVKKYSDYLRYPIQMECEHSHKKEGADENDKDAWETYTSLDTLNSMTPLWKKDKKDTTDDELNCFYKDKFNDFSDPAKVIRSKTEGAATYVSMLFIPSRQPYNYYSKDYEKGLELYSSGVLIMEKCAELLPDHFSFVKGLVDSEDLSLNISREMLQHDRQLKLIAKSIEKKIKNELAAWLKKDRKEYEAFFENFGLQLKYGLYASFGMYKDELKDLVLFASSFEEKLVTLKEYVSRMKEDQKEIYYACGANVKQISRLPQTEAVREKGYEVLYLTESVDEFALKMLAEYDEKPFKNVAAGDLELQTDEEKEKANKQSEQYKEMFEFMKQTLDGKAAEVRLSARLKSTAVCLSAAGDMSIEMEKTLNAMPSDQKVHAQRVLELNPDHPAFAKLWTVYQSDRAKAAEYTKLLYTQAALIEGIAPEDPVEFSNQICKLMAE